MQTSNSTYPLDQRLPAGLLLAGIVVVTGASNTAAANDDLWSHFSEQAVIVEGDILAPAHPTQRAIVKSLEPSLWQDGIIPYRIDDALPMVSIVSVTDAIEHWNRVSGITLRPVEEMSNPSTPVRDVLRFIPGNVCASWVGRRGGEQPLWVAPNCNSGSVMHEIGHALGLEHEHTRPDRGNFINIHWENIDPDKRHNFDVASSSSRMLGDYDYQSIMHYGQTTFSINGEPTITPKQEGVTGLGQRRSPSRGDLEGIAELYGTDLSIVTRAYDSQDRLSDEPTDMHVHVTNQRSQGAHNIDLQIAAADGITLTNGENPDWQCTRSSHDLIQCNLQRLTAGSTALFTFEAYGKLQAGAVEATINSKTPDFDLSNNSTSEYKEGSFALSQDLPLATQTSGISGTDSQAVGHVSLAGSISQSWYLLLLLLIKSKRIRYRIRTGCKHGWDLYRR